ncbi:hypothetical protein CRG98_041248 [Punica granatum]|uniref:Uncharacterized protein n=1 Tax=Punica granatum TaxID=22663 RepID=A0A2I0I324_PUNGR|nr:hypothetical protein CRG98_041248 [Punica granatum]
MNGVVYSLITDQGNLRFRDLTGKRPDDDGSNRLVTDLAKSLARDTLIGIVLWALYELVTSGRSRKVEKGIVAQPQAHHFNPMLPGSLSLRRGIARTEVRSIGEVG